jgi:hypothetical protein
MTQKSKIKTFSNRHNSAAGRLGSDRQLKTQAGKRNCVVRRDEGKTKSVRIPERAHHQMKNCGGYKSLGQDATLARS